MADGRWSQPDTFGTGPYLELDRIGPLIIAGRGKSRGHYVSVCRSCN